MSNVNQYLLAFTETKHDTMCFNLATPLLNLELYIVSECRHYAKKSTHPGKKHKKHSSPSKKSKPQKKAQKSTMVLLKALATIPEASLRLNSHSNSSMIFSHLQVRFTGELIDEKPTKGDGILLGAICFIDCTLRFDKTFVTLTELFVVLRGPHFHIHTVFTCLRYSCWALSADKPRI